MTDTTPKLTVDPTPIQAARAYLARRFRGEWDDLWLFCRGNRILVHFDPVVDRAGVSLWLAGLEVAKPGTGLGGQVIEALRTHTDQTTLPLFAGPATNHAYWVSDDGTHPRRHPWLTMVGSHRGELVYAYAPGSVDRPLIQAGRPLPLADRPASTSSSST